MHAQQSLEKKKTRTAPQLLALFLLVVGTPALWYWWSLSSNRSPKPPASSSLSSAVSEISLKQPFPESEDPSSSAPSRTREVFPYSVIPGGVRSAQELREAARNDALVAQHYSGFDFESARVIHAPKDRQVYVSYRIGSRIFWTRRTVTIHAGENLLTDGQNLARGRCGNRISESPKSPSSPDEPSDFAMSAPVVFQDPAPLGFLVEDGSPSLALLPQPPTSVPPSSNTPPGGSFPPISPPVFVGPGSPSTLLPPSVQPVVSTPEPGSFLLVALGLAALAFLRFGHRFSTPISRLK